MSSLTQNECRLQEFLQRYEDINAAPNADELLASEETMEDILKADQTLSDAIVEVFPMVLRAHEDVTTTAEQWDDLDLRRQRFMDVVDILATHCYHYLHEHVTRSLSTFADAEDEDQAIAKLKANYLDHMNAYLSAVAEAELEDGYEGADESDAELSEASEGRSVNEEE
ncbi:hypothetical protein CYLTODRAFT_414991 [Cylindrobasidium torrendii FP15055 ss-10]|uniref:Uncharacterized protein n=1 Tax=Cylindrobasidium torrendii FP15055 ss-10 TaxID=1314674 RepID=A0A0D7AV28_9AGAR|nr:hypothetical protein CYLTODRAFT_414991 [Cylindrobasidium torrendii FP15055 ss-10]